MKENDSYWFALYTRPRWEKKVAALLCEKNIENYCPLNKVLKQWSDRKKIVLEPVFKSYVFVRIQEDKKWELKKISGIVNFVYWLGKPARIRDEEIILIKKFLNDFYNVQIEQDAIPRINTKVRIKQGALMNYHGVLLEVTGNRAKVRLESMGVQLSAHFDKGNLESLLEQDIKIYQ